MKAFEYSTQRSLKILFSLLVWLVFPFFLIMFFYYGTQDKILTIWLSFLFAFLCFVIPGSFHLNYYMMDRHKKLQIDTQKKVLIVQDNGIKNIYPFAEIKGLELWKNHSIHNNWGMYYYYKIIPKDDNKYTLFISCLVVNDLEKELPEIPFEERSAVLPYMGR